MFQISSLKLLLPHAITCLKPKKRRIQIIPQSQNKFQNNSGGKKIHGALHNTLIPGVPGIMTLIYKNIEPLIFCFSFSLSDPLKLIIHQAHLPGRICIYRRKFVFHGILVFTSSRPRSQAHPVVFMNRRSKQIDLQKCFHYKNNLAHQLAFWRENNNIDSGLPSI